MTSDRVTQLRALHQVCGGGPHAARSTVYGWSHALSLFGELNRRGLIGDDYRDQHTGRKVRSLVQEIARLGPAHLTDEQRDTLVQRYLDLREHPISQVRDMVRDELARAAGQGTSTAEVRAYVLPRERYIPPPRGSRLR